MLKRLIIIFLLLTPTAKFNAYINYDYGTDKNIGKGSSHWTGIAGAARFQATSIFAITPRLEWFNDADGFFLPFFITGGFKQIQERHRQKGVIVQIRRQFALPFAMRGQPAAFGCALIFQEPLGGAYRRLRILRLL